MFDDLDEHNHETVEVPDNFFSKIRYEAIEEIRKRVKNGVATASELIFLASLDEEGNAYNRKIQMHKANLLQAQTSKVRLDLNMSRLIKDAIDAMGSYRGYVGGENEND